MLVYEAPFANMKKGHQRWPEMSLILGRPGTQYVVMVTKLKLWSTLSRILLQRNKHFCYKLAEISFFIIFDQN